MAISPFAPLKAVSGVPTRPPTLGVAPHEQPIRRTDVMPPSSPFGNRDVGQMRSTGMGGGGKAPRDNSDKVAAIEAQSAREAQAAAEAQRQRDQADFDARMNSSFGSGIADAESFFTSRGLDPSQYRGAITTKANQLRGGIPNLSGNPGAAYAGLGSSVFDELQEGARGKAMRGINAIAPAGFETSRIGNTADDETLAAILSEQETAGRGYIDNLRARGVITDSGYNAALQNLMGQKAGAQSKLSDIGSGILEGGRGEASNLVNRYRSQASNLNLGDTFDPYATVAPELNNFFTEFLGGLGQKIRGQAPSNLFDTSGLANIAGASQGAGNNAFNPAAVGSMFGGEQDDDEDTLFNTSPF